MGGTRPWEEPWGGLGRPGEPWDLGRPGIRALLETEDPGRRPPLESFGPWGAMWIPRATRGRWQEEYDPNCKPKPGQAVGEFRGQRSAKP